MPSRCVTIESLLLMSLLVIALTAPSHGAVVPLAKRSVQEVKPPVAPAAPLSRKYQQNHAMPVKKEAGTAGNGAFYTIKAGDNLFKILMREYGLTNRQAEKFIEVVSRENNISNFRKLRIGQKIIVSTPNRKSPAGSLNVPRKPGRAGASTPKPAEQEPVPVQMFSLVKPVAPVLHAADNTANVKKVWEKIVPGQQYLNKAVAVNSENISISLDSLKYPLLTAMDGGRILVDVEGKISPTVKSVIANTDPGLRIVSEPAAHPKRFLASLIEAGRFYSVEKDFVMEFGQDPKLTIRSDFRVERTADSIVNHDTILLNTGNTALPATLIAFLKNEGLTVYEPFAVLKPHTYLPRNRLVTVASPMPLDIAGSVLKALSITAEENARIHTADIDGSGISITITPDRYFYHKGKAYSITYAKDPHADNSLIPILEARGIHSIVLNHSDDFRKISERILTTIGVSGQYGFHTLWPEEDTGYSLQMSGIMIDGAGASGESLFLTNREIDRIIKDISVDNGYIVQN